MTAFQLSNALTAAGVTLAADAGKLALTGPVPPSLMSACKVLKTGLLALASGRRWWGVESPGGHWLLLDTRLTVPDSVGLLAAEGAARWDRVRPGARLDCPHLFAAAAPAKGGKS